MKVKNEVNKDVEVLGLLIEADDYLAEEGTEDQDKKLTLPIGTNYKRSNNKSLLDLPNEIWIQILGYLEIKFLLTNVALVSKRFYKLSKDREIWKNHLVIKNVSNMSEDDLAQNFKLLEYFKSLKSVTITSQQGKVGNGYQEMNKLAIKALESCSKLRTLELIYYKTEKSQDKPKPWLLSKTMKIIKEKGTSLRDLVLKNIRLKESPTFFNDLPKLKLSIIDGLDGIPPKDIPIPTPSSPKALVPPLAPAPPTYPLVPITPIIPHHSSVKKIAMHITNDSKKSFTITLDSIDFQCEKIEFLKFNGAAMVHLSTGPAQPTMKKFYNCHGLEELKIYGQAETMTQLDLGTLAQIPMKRLILKDMPFASIYLIKFIRDLNKTHLECLVINNCAGMDYQVFLQMSRCNFPKLERYFIYTNDTNMTPVSNCIRYQLENWTFLKSISMINNNSLMSHLEMAKLITKFKVFITDYDCKNDSPRSKKIVEEYLHFTHQFKFKNHLDDKFFQMKEEYDQWCEQNIDWN